MRCAHSNPPDDLRNLKLFKDKFGEFEQIKSLRVFPEQRLFILVCKRPNSNSIIALWDDVEAWVPDNLGLYGKHIEEALISGKEPDLRYMLGVGLNYKQSIINNKLMWVDIPNCIIPGERTVPMTGGVRLSYTVFYNNVFSVYEGPKPHCKYIGFLAPLGEPMKFVQITEWLDSDDAVKAIIEKQCGKV